MYMKESVVQFWLVQEVFLFGKWDGSFPLRKLEIQLPILIFLKNYAGKKCNKKKDL